MRQLMTLLMVLAVSLCVIDPVDAAFLVKGQNVKVMPVGDSITLGKGGMVGGYRKILYEWLIANGYAITYVGKQNLPGNPKYPAACSDGSIPYHEGYGSIRTDMVLTGGTVERQTAPPLATSLEKFKPDVVLLMIGTNDILQTYQWDTLEERLGKIIDTIYALNPKTIVLVASIAPIGGWTYVAKEARVTAYNAAIPGIVAKQQALGHRIGFVDIHRAMSAKGALGNDMVHPSDMGYALMAQAWYKALTGEEAPAIADPKNPLMLPPPVVPAGSITPAPAGSPAVH